jgi:hypothetical protein
LAYCCGRLFSSSAGTRLRRLDDLPTLT